METAEFKRRGRLVHNQYLAGLNTVCAGPALADQPLARAFASKHIWFMNRSAIKSTIQLTLIAVNVVLFWLFGFSDPCLGTEISNHFTAHDPPVIAPVTGGTYDATVVVENPYGIKTCHYWRTTANDITSELVLGLFLFSIGWFAARRVPQRPLLTAAGVTVFALVFALALQFFARFDGNLYFSHTRSDLIQLDFLLVLVVIMVGACVAMLGAWVSRVFVHRA
jgi:hypothetical protein